jgi:chromosome partitioning protein
MSDASPSVEPRAVTSAVLKGGVGKSMLTTNTARALADRGHRVLEIDMDPNGHATTGLGFESTYQNADQHIGDVMLGDRTAAPEDVIIDTGYGFDLLPAHRTLENLNVELANADFGTVRLRRFVVEPLLETAYDYIVIDAANERNKISDNALTASLNMLIPLTPGSGLRGFRRTMERQIRPLREFRDLEILALVPNRIKRRIDHRTTDRELIEGLCTTDNLSKKVPNFGYVAPETFTNMDAGEWDDPLPKPGLREDTDIERANKDAEVPLAEYNPENDQLDSFDELAAIVERGGVDRE